MTNLQDKPQPAEPIAATAPDVQQPAVDQVPPSAGGCYTRDPSTGELTLATPSTKQE